jgi:hypothetical protein
VFANSDFVVLMAVTEDVSSGLAWTAAVNSAATLANRIPKWKYIVRGTGLVALRPARELEGFTGEGSLRNRCCAMSPSSGKIELHRGEKLRVGGAIIGPEAMEV